MNRDYSPKGVKFFYIYKTLAHPELAGNYVQPFTLEERLAHAGQAERQLGGTIPWIVDAMDNRLKHVLGDRPNSEFIVNPEGIIVSKRQWSHPAQVRKDLENLVGPVDHVTKEEDVVLDLQLPLKAPAARGVVPRLRRGRMQPLVMVPLIEPGDVPFFAKLRAEADQRLMTRGIGQMYIGFHVDPFHNAHWNNLTEPLSFELEVPEGVKIDKLSYKASKVEVTSDTDPREFLLNIEAWPEDEPIRLTVTYFACVGEESCHMVRQKYTLYRRRDEDGGGARGEGAGFWEADEFAEQLISGDTDRDGKLSRSEVRGLVLPHFETLDQDGDGLLDAEELRTVSDWLNFHHKPGLPSSEFKLKP